MDFKPTRNIVHDTIINLLHVAKIVDQDIQVASHDLRCLQNFVIGYSHSSDSSQVPDNVLN